MKVTARLLAVVVTAGIAGVGALALMSPAVANTVTHPFVTAARGGPGPGNGMGNGMGNRMGYGAGAGRGAGMCNGVGAGDGTCDLLEATAAKGTLGPQQRTSLAALAQEEKLAHDLYVAFAARYDAAVFDRIPVAEEHHLTALRTLLGRYEVADPTVGQAAGKFTDSAVRASYDRLLAEGSKDQKTALGIARTVEQTDIDDLTRALAGLSAPDAQQVYTHLVTASRQHLVVFDAWSKR